MDERLARADAIVFDVGNVLLRFDPDRVVTLLPEEHRAALAGVMFGTRHQWGRFDLGAESNEEIALSIASEAGVPGGEGMVLYALYHFHETMDRLPMYSLLPELRKAGKRLFALTNYPEPSFTFACRAFPYLTECLEGAVVSSREKLVKPEPAIFHFLTRKYDLIPSRTLFIDDTAANTDAAAREGFRVWHYAGKDRLQPARS